jgi:hypothetical protein
MWPMALAAAATDVIAMRVLPTLGAVPTVLGSVAIGLGIASARWSIWLRRHPVIPPEEWFADMRRAARWN